MYHENFLKIYIKGVKRCQTCFYTFFYTQSKYVIIKKCFNRLYFCFLTHTYCTRENTFILAKWKWIHADYYRISEWKGGNVLPYIVHTAQYYRVEWFGTLLRFSKLNTLLSSRYIFKSSIPKNRQNRPHVWESFHFQKIAGALKINIFCCCKFANTFLLL